MAAWPTVADYKQAIQNPAHCFGQADLRSAQAALDRRGLPVLWQGNFAVVFKLICQKNNDVWAIKCFHRHITDLCSRYRAIDEHLTRHKADLPFTVEFRFLEEGIRINGEWFPVLKMRWVDGVNLNDFVRENIRNARLLQRVADLMIGMGKQLSKAGVAHGDLQHGNILIVAKDEKKATLKLVDYDGAFVPALAGVPPEREVGHPNFQHKERLRTGAYDASIDRFPLLVIYCALHSLALQGEPLWNAFDNGDNLLFRESDFEDPGRSALLRRLWSSSDARIKAMVGRLILASQEQLDCVPIPGMAIAWGPQPLTPSEATAVERILAAKAVGVQHDPRHGNGESAPVLQPGNLVSCKACGATLRVPSTAGGKNFLCPKCRMPMHVPKGLGDETVPRLVPSGRPPSAARDRDPAGIKSIPFPKLFPDEWYFVRNGAVLGPYSAEQLARYAATGELLPADMLMHAGETGFWSTADSHPWLDYWFWRYQ